MKKRILFIISFVLISCNDGDLDIPAFEFNENIEICGSYLLYRTNTDATEALILNLGNTSFETTVGVNEIAVSSSNSINYRIFNDAIGNNYFCQSIPPSTPTVVKELNAQNATIVITTRENIANTSGFEYDIVIKNLTFSDGNNKIYYETYTFATALDVN